LAVAKKGLAVAAVVTTLAAGGAAVEKVVSDGSGPDGDRARAGARPAPPRLLDTVTSRTARPTAHRSHVRSRRRAARDARASDLNEGVSTRRSQAARPSSLDSTSGSSLPDDGFGGSTLAPDSDTAPHSDPGTDLGNVTP
jgi:hypothetical protein